LFGGAKRNSPIDKGYVGIVYPSKK
jgi:hypothetical protein